MDIHRDFPGVGNAFSHCDMVNQCLHHFPVQFFRIDVLFDWQELFVFLLDILLDGGKLFFVIFYMFFQAFFFSGEFPRKFYELVL